MCRWHTLTPMSWGLTWTCCSRFCWLRTPGRHTGQITSRQNGVQHRFCCHSGSFCFALFCRIHNVLKGIPDDRDGLFDTIQRSKNHYQKRAYQCIKCMVALFSNCSVAYQILQVWSFCLIWCQLCYSWWLTGKKYISATSWRVFVCSNPYPLVHTE